MMIGLFKHYAEALQFRFHLLDEYFRLGKTKAVNRALLLEILRNPGDAEDWINLLRFIEPGEPLMIIDIGANVGAFTGGALRHFPEARAVCFEPCSEPFLALEQRFADNHRVTCHRVAISTQDESREMFIQKGASHYNTFHRYNHDANRFHNLKYDAVEHVESRRLDGFDIDTSGQVLLKIDTQGHEVDVIEGAGDILDGVDVALVETSFAMEYEDIDPSFPMVTELLRKHNLYPIIFQGFGGGVSNYAFERDVVFARKELLNNIFFHDR